VLELPRLVAWLQIARRHADEFCRKLGYSHTNMEFRKGGPCRPLNLPTPRRFRRGRCSKPLEKGGGGGICLKCMAQLQEIPGCIEGHSPRQRAFPTSTVGPCKSTSMAVAASQQQQR
jgi:hypothetical protein